MSRLIVLNRLAFGVLAAVVLALVVLNVLALSGRLVDEDSPARTNEATVAVEPPPAPTPTAPPAAEPGRRTIAGRKRSAKPGGPRSSVTAVVLTATRGDCWVEVRAGSSTGEALYTGTLTAGDSLRFKRPKLWLRLGAASNVDLVVNGRPSRVPPGTVEFVVPDV